MWDELDALADQVRTLLNAGAFRGCGPMAIGIEHSLDVELFARVTLADVSHVRWEEREGSSSSYLTNRQRGLLDDLKRLLARVGVSDGL